jgi:NTE family protein
VRVTTITEKLVSRSSAAAKGVGLVLSGGGSRGVAHIGVIRALLEHGIEPDHVAGASAGALVGALYAAGYSPEQMLEVFRVIEPLRFKHVAFGKPGLLDSAKYLPAFAKYFPQDSFAALRRKLFIVATDLLSGESRVFSSGPLVAPMVASASVPMVYSPMEIEGRWYGDGGIVDNFPARTLRERCAFVIGVHVSPLRPVTQSDLGTSLAVVERALEIGMFQKSRADFSLCDAVIQPADLAQFTMFDTKRLAEVEAAGYAAGKRQAPAIARALRRNAVPLARRKRDALAQIKASGA